MKKLSIEECIEILRGILEAEKRRQHKVKKLRLELMELEISRKIKDLKNFENIPEELNIHNHLDEKLVKSMIKTMEETFACDCNV